ncbi:Crp/Fnr family transcriptional regulator [Viridibacterium curvum]
MSQLPLKDRKRLQSLCVPVELSLSQVLSEPGETTRCVYFPSAAFVSLLAVTAGKPGIEVAMIGSEGMLGAEIGLGVTTAPLRTLVQGSGLAWRVGATSFGHELARSPALQACVRRYVHVLMMQLATSAVCLHYHAITPRLARWLLMSQDRAHARSIHVTHEFLASMMGVRRVSVTTAASALQRSGLIIYHRGELTVLDRKGLENAACDCYRAGRQAYTELL